MVQVALNQLDSAQEHQLPRSEGSLLSPWGSLLDQPEYLQPQYLQTTLVVAYLIQEVEFPWAWVHLTTPILKPLHPSVVSEVHQVQVRLGNLLARLAPSQLLLVDFSAILGQEEAPCLAVEAWHPLHNHKLR